MTILVFELNFSDLFCRVAVKVLDFPDLTLCTSQPTGLHTLACGYLHSLGYTVVVVGTRGAVPCWAQLFPVGCLSTLQSVGNDSALLDIK